VLVICGQIGHYLWTVTFIIPQQHIFTLCFDVCYLCIGNVNVYGGVYVNKCE